MGQAPKGIFGEFIEGLAKDFEMKSIVEASRDDAGKIDAAKAAGIAIGLGYTSLEDTVRFGDILNASGAFDDNPSLDDEDSFADDDDGFDDDGFADDDDGFDDGGFADDDDDFADDGFSDSVGDFSD